MTCKTFTGYADDIETKVNDFFDEIESEGETSIVSVTQTSSEGFLSVIIIYEYV